ncbi:hypothetical protein ABIE67_005050 [Streptomyces sp. V4I8]
MSVRWTVLVVRIPAEPSRHRVAVWRELRKTAALCQAPDDHGTVAAGTDR